MIDVFHPEYLRVWFTHDGRRLVRATGEQVAPPDRHGHGYQPVDGDHWHVAVLGGMESLLGVGIVPSPHSFPRLPPVATWGLRNGIAPGQQFAVHASGSTLDGYTSGCGFAGFGATAATVVHVQPMPAREQQNRWTRFLREWMAGADHWSTAHVVSTESGVVHINAAWQREEEAGHVATK